MKCMSCNHFNCHPCAWIYIMHYIRLSKRHPWVLHVHQFYASDYFYDLCILITYCTNNENKCRRRSFQQQNPYTYHSSNAMNEFGPIVRLGNSRCESCIVHERNAQQQLDYQELSGRLFSRIYQCCSFPLWTPTVDQNLSGNCYITQYCYNTPIRRQ